MIEEINGSNKVLPESNEDEICSKIDTIESDITELSMQLKLTRAELQNRTGSILRMEQKIDILIKQLIELNVVKVNK